MSKPVTLESILHGFSPRNPGLIRDLIDTITSEGIPLDLGPMTPDVRARFDAIAAEERDRLRKKFEDDGSSKR